MEKALYKFQLLLLLLLPKIGNSIISGHPNFQGKSHLVYTEITTMKMRFSSGIKYVVHKKCHRNYIGVKKVQIYF